MCIYKLYMCLLVPSAGEKYYHNRIRHSSAVVKKLEHVSELVLLE